MNNTGIIHVHCVSLLSLIDIDGHRLSSLFILNVVSTAISVVFPRSIRRNSST